MRQNAWHPRIAPYLVYLATLALVNQARQWQLVTYPIGYTLQAALVIWLLWRYRRLLPEIGAGFHWLALPVGAAVFVVWVALGRAMVHWFPALASADGPHYFEQMKAQSTALYATSLSLRLLGMALLVPVFEELFVRSLLLRSFHNWRRVGVGIVQLVQDVPLVGDWLIGTSLGMRAGRHPPVFATEFEKTPLGKLSVFGVAVSTGVFMLGHHLRDWPAAVVCGVAYCLLLAFAVRRNPRLRLGPVIWAHGITNALLWAYCVYTGTWMFL